jgi:hypothetical protein
MRNVRCREGKYPGLVQVPSLTYRNAKDRFLVHCDQPVAGHLAKHIYFTSVVSLTRQGQIEVSYMVNLQSPIGPKILLHGHELFRSSDFSEFAPQLAKRDASSKEDVRV